MNARIETLRAALEQAEIALNRAHVALGIAAENGGRPETSDARNAALAARDRIARVLRRDAGIAS